MEFVCRSCRAQWRESSAQCPRCGSFLISNLRLNRFHPIPPLHTFSLIDNINQLPTQNPVEARVAFQAAAHNILLLANQIILGTGGGRPQQMQGILNPRHAIFAINVTNAHQEAKPGIRPLTPSNFKHRHIHRKDVKNKEVCPICYEDLKRGEKVCELPCKHIFHDVCIREWFQRESSCPMCRKVLGDKPRLAQAEQLPQMRTFIFTIG